MLIWPTLGTGVSDGKDKFHTLLPRVLISPLSPHLVLSNLADIQDILKINYRRSKQASDGHDSYLRGVWKWLILTVFFWVPFSKQEYGHVASIYLLIPIKSERHNRRQLCKVDAVEVLLLLPSLLPMAIILVNANTCKKNVVY